MRLRFNDRAVKAIKPPEQGLQVDYFDDDLRGFGLRVSYGGVRSWFVMYRHGGRKRRLKIGPYPALGLAEAKEMAREALNKVAKGIDPAAEKQALKRAGTVAEMAADYLERYAKVHKRAWRLDRATLNNDLVPALGARRLHEVSRRDIRDVLDKIAARAPVQANRALEIIRKAWNWAIEQDLATDNPCAGIKPLAKESARERNYTDDELKALWAAVGREGDRIADSIKLLALTAQREAEVLRMRVSDVDLANAWWSIPGEHAKNSRPHAVPLAPAALAIIKRRIEADPAATWVFPQVNENLATKRNLYNKALPRIRKNSGVADFRIHDLRRTAATGMGRLGISAFDIGRVLNHADTNVTRRHYALHDYGPEKRRALDIWAKHLLQVVGEMPPASNITELELRRTAKG